MNKCPDEDKIDGYLKGKLAEADAAQFEEHYFNCPSCFQKTYERNELMELIKQRGAAIFEPATRRVEAKVSFGEKIAALLTPRQWGAAAVAAALLLAVVLAVGPRLKNQSPSFVFTGDETVRGEALIGLSPRGDIKDFPSVFEWKALNGAAEYQVLLSGIEPLWTAATTETKISLPQDAKNKLKSGISYTWQVKAYSGQGAMLAASPKIQFKISS